MKTRFRRIIILLTADITALIVSYIGALYLFRPQEVINTASMTWRNFPFVLVSEIAAQSSWRNVPIVVAAGLVAFISLRLYRTLWRYASIDALIIIFFGTTFATLLSAGAILYFDFYYLNWPKFVVMWMMLLLLVGAGRFSVRIYNTVTRNKTGKKRRRILIYGAGDAGEMIARDIQQKGNGHNLRLVGFIDDDPSKKGTVIHNARIFGGRECVKEIIALERVDELVVAMPSLAGNQMREILNYLKSELNGKVNLQTLPGVPELIDGRVTLEQARQFSISDLLRRKPVELDVERVRHLLHGKSVLVTGAGGSIGSEICRQVANCNPAKLIIVDISEASLYLIHEELCRMYGTLEIVPVVVDVCHRLPVERIFEEHRPGIVFHAAAYKHVPLMEDNPWSAVMNNIISTRILTSVSAEYNVGRFVMISTDKAVRPTSMMGATKRLCELLVEHQPHNPESLFCVVRFGNVMGSSGSVILKFEQQIRARQPVTVTHPDVTRYFMLTSEAVQLVLQAATLEQDNAIYILEMGDPVRIADLAEDMIRLSGLEPNVDIPILFTGLRPGEKLHEELYHNGCGAATEIEKIYMAEIPCHDGGKEEFHRSIDDLLEKCYTLSKEELYRSVAKLVPDFGHSAVLNAPAKSAGASLRRGRIAGTGSGKATGAQPSA